MKKKQSPEEVLAAFIAANPQSNKTAISEGTGLKGIVLVNSLKKMVKAGGLTEEGTGKEAIYTVAEPAAEKSAETSNELEVPVEDEQLASKTKAGKRNNDKFRFNTFPEALGKGALVREIIKDFVSKNKKATLKSLDEIWKPTDLLKRFGIYAEISRAKELSARDRYFFQEEHQIRLADKKIIVVSNQQTSSTLQVFIKAAKALGYKISVAK